MKHRSTVVPIAVFAFTLLPAVTQAATEAQALQACVKAMARSIEAKNGAPVGTRLVQQDTESRRLLHWETVFHLDAADAASGKSVARMACYVNSNAKVMDLKKL